MPARARAVRITMVSGGITVDGPAPDLDAASVASRLGYNDASHFNWEYKCLFGDPPMREVQRLWEAASAVPSR